MGKRGGRRRKRASQWEATAANDASDDPTTQSNNKRPKVDDPKSSKAANDSLKNGILEDRVEAALMGVESSKTASLPPPFSWDEKEGLVLVNSNKSLEATNHHQTRLSAVWKYLAHNHHNKGQNEPWKPSEIQRHLWSILLESTWNTIGVASTGSGKTLAYAIPTALSRGSVLVLVPTRELVVQVCKVFQKAVKAIRHDQKQLKKQQEEESGGRAGVPSIPIVTIHGGTSRAPQQQGLEDAATAEKCIVVATPGRFLDLINDTEQPTRLLPVFQWIVLDEADQLAKDGDLGPQVEEILNATRHKPSTSAGDGEATRLVLVSATYPERARPRFLEWVGTEHALVQVNHVQNQSSSTTTESTTALSSDKEKSCGMPVSQGDPSDGKIDKQAHADSFARIPPHLEQILHVCSEHKKPRKLLHTLQQIYKKYPNQRSRPLGIVFVSKIEKLKHISKLLDKEGITNVTLHSQLPSTQVRQANLAQFACGQKPLLLATDVAARGIDIPSVLFVIQYDFPGNLQQYVHRCGRAGRSLAPADASKPKPTIYSFFTRNLQAMAPDLVRLLEVNNAWVDPNLRALAQGEAGGKSTKKKKKHDPKTDVELKAKDSDGEGDDEPEDDFPELAPNRIVLKRASHVSDASSGDSSEYD